MARTESLQFRENLGLRFKLMRDYLNITSTEAAERFGRSQASVSAYENGKRVPPLEYSYKFCRACGIKVEELFELPMKVFTETLYS